MEYIKAAKTDDFSGEHKKLVTVNEKKILLALVEGKYYAVDNTCTHMGGSLYNGKLDGFNVVCPRHGSTFDVRTGKLSAKGKLAFIKVSPPDIRAYPVKTEGTDILIGIE